jgi:putative membrane protein
MTPLSLEAKIWFYLVSVMLILSGLDPVADRLTWWLETTPALIGLIVLSLTRAQFPLTNISYRLIAVFSLILIFGGHYTYAENPLFNWIQEQWALERNYYDRLGHFFPRCGASHGWSRDFIANQSTRERKMVIFHFVHHQFSHQCLL